MYPHRLESTMAPIRSDKIEEKLQLTPSPQGILGDIRIKKNLLAMSWDVVALREINHNETIKVLLDDNDDDDDLIWQILRYAIGGDKSETTDSR
jgi:hypothetical protein